MIPDQSLEPNEIKEDSAETAENEIDFCNKRNENEKCLIYFYLVF